MPKGELLKAVPALSTPDLKENVKLAAEHRYLIDKIAKSLDFISEPMIELGWKADKFDISLMVTPKSHQVIGSENDEVKLEESPYSIYVLLAEYVGGASRETFRKARAVVVTKDGQIGTVSAQFNGEDFHDFTVDIRLDEDRILTIFKNWSEVSGCVTVGDYYENYSGRHFFDATTKDKVIALREIAAILPKE